MEAESSFGVETKIGIIMEKTSNLLDESLKAKHVTEGLSACVWELMR